MCLARVTTRNPKKTEGIGYKVFRVKLNEDILHLHWHRGLKPRVIGRWYTSSKGTFNPKSQRGVPTYPLGFHIYLDKPKGCDSFFKIYKVQYKEAHTLGVDGGRRTVIAHKMKILERVK